MSITAIALALGGVATLLASDWVHALEREAEQRLLDAEEAVESPDLARM